ncbi:MAG: HD domain-containing protein, partial [Isosphaeraceae bacterium]
MLNPQGPLLSVPVPTTLDRLADRLHEEFAAPVGLFDLNERQWKVRLGARPETFPEPGDCSFLSTVRCGRADLWRPRDDVGPIWLIVPVSGPKESELAAWMGFTKGPGPLKPWGPPCPERALMAWGQDVADRLRTKGAGQTPTTNLAATPALIEHLIRRLRVSDPPERFQRLATSATRDALGVEAVAWVPAPSREPVILAGQVDGLEPEAVRDLLPESWNDLAWVVNRSTDPKNQTSRRIAAVAADTGAPTGWLVALNPGNGRPFTSADVEILQPVASIVGTQRGNARLYVELKELLFGVVRALTSAIDAKDPYTSGHSERVARIAVRLGEALGMSSHQRGDLYLMGLLHDIGKIGVEDVVLKKPGPLTSEEYRQIQLHVGIGVRILADLKKLHHLL